MCQNCESKGLSRRQIMHAASALLAASAIGTSSTFAAEPAGDRPNAISPSDAFDELNKGHAQYLADQPVDQKDYAVNRAANAAAQYPIASVLACADSRVPPEIVFDQGPGDLFVVRVAGNVVSTYGLASMVLGCCPRRTGLVFGGRTHELRRCRSGPAIGLAKRSKPLRPSSRAC
ncbi:MAG: carbonic anhydrase [Hyphomicrobiales bacterium]